MPIAVRATAALIVALLLTAPGQAAARKDCSPAQTPPGNSEIDQYVETIPGACGKEQFEPSGVGTGAPGASDAAAARSFAQATAPQDGEPRGAKARGNDSEETSAVSEISEAVAGGSEGGMGIWLPLLLGAVVAAAVAAGLLRWRSRRAG